MTQYLIIGDIPNMSGTKLRLRNLDGTVSGDAAGYTATDISASDNDGQYRASVPESIVGQRYVVHLDGTRVSASGYVTMLGTADSVNIIGESSSGITITDVETAITNSEPIDANIVSNALGTAIQVTGPVISASEIQVVEFDDYPSIDNPKIEFTVGTDYSTADDVYLLIWKRKGNTRLAYKQATAVVDSATKISVTMTATFDETVIYPINGPAELRFALVAKTGSAEDQITSGKCWVHERNQPV